MPAEFYGKDGGTWRQVDPSLGLHFNDAGTWRDLSEAHYNDGGTWRKVYQKSDPVTYEFAPALKAEYFFNGSIHVWNTSPSHSTRVGSFFSGFIPYSTADYVTVMDFTTSTDSTSGLTLAQALLARPTVSACEVELDMQYANTGGNVTSGTYYFSWNSGGYGSGAIVMESSFQSTYSFSTSAPTKWFSGTAHVFDGLDTGLPSKLATNTLTVSNTLSPGNAGGSDTDAVALEQTAFSHKLRVTLDF